MHRRAQQREQKLEQREIDRELLLNRNSPVRKFQICGVHTFMKENVVMVGLYAVRPKTKSCFEDLRTKSIIMVKKKTFREI